MQRTFWGTVRQGKIELLDCCRFSRRNTGIGDFDCYWHPPAP